MEDKIIFQNNFLENKNKKDKKLLNLFIDFSTTCTGYTIATHYPDQSTKIQTFGFVKKKVKTKKRNAETNEEFIDRLFTQIMTDILSLGLRDNTINLVIEDSFSGVNPKTDYTLAFYRAMLITMLHPHEFCQMMPSSWRKHLAGFNQAKDKKAKAKETAGSMAGITQEDCCESFCIALAWGCEYNGLTYDKYLETRRQ